MILNASAENGSDSAGWRLTMTSSSPTLWPSIASTSSGDGR